MIQSPKINLLYYKNILDNVLVYFFRDFNNDFQKIDGDYVFCGSITRNRLRLYFRKLILEELKKFTTEYSVMTPNYYFIIGSCFPKDNLLLDYIKDDVYFPAKLKNKLETISNKYTLRERDIKIDLDTFNSIFEDIFNELFNHDKLNKYLGRKMSRNIFFIKNSRLDCYMFFKTVKHIYGDINVINMHKENISEMKCNLYSFNELIDKYIHHKKDIVRSPSMSYLVNEIKQYMSMLINGVLSNG